MIPALNIVAWSNTVPWAEQRQVEQDLIISRGIVAIFADPALSGELRFRGGTALNKLHFAAPLRYSEDIELIRTSAGPIGPILDGIRTVMEPWLGRAQLALKHEFLPRRSLHGPRYGREQLLCSGRQRPNYGAMRRREQEPSTPSIENAFAKLKALLRARAERTVSALWDAVGELLDAFTPIECENYFRAAGYGPD